MAGLPAEAAATVYMSRFLAHAGIAARPDGEDVRKAARALPGAPAIAAAARSARPALVKLHELAKASPSLSLDEQLRSLDAPPAPLSISGPPSPPGVPSACPACPVIDLGSQCSTSSPNHAAFF